MSQPIAVAVVRHGGQFLIGQRPAGAPLAGFWEFPGGKVRDDESPREAACRECQEETGLEVEILAELARVRHDYPHGELELRFFECRPIGSVETHAPFRWVDIKELMRREFPPANTEVIRMLARRFAAAS